MNNLFQVKNFNRYFQSLATNFCCGNSYLDYFLRNSNALDDGFGKTYIMTCEDDNEIIGFYNIGVGYLEQKNGPVVNKIGGSIHLNCFALDQKYQKFFYSHRDNGSKIYLSDLLLNDCFTRVYHLRKKYIGFAFITLNSSKEGYNLYLRNGFEPLEEDMHFSATEKDIGIPMYYALDIE